MRNVDRVSEQEDEYEGVRMLKSKIKVAMIPILQSGCGGDCKGVRVESTSKISIHRSGAGPHYCNDK